MTARDRAIAAAALLAAAAPLFAATLPTGTAETLRLESRAHEPRQLRARRDVIVLPASAPTVWRGEPTLRAERAERPPWVAAALHRRGPLGAFEALQQPPWVVEVSAPAVWSRDLARRDATTSQRALAALAEGRWERARVLRLLPETLLAGLPGVGPTAVDALLGAVEIQPPPAGPSPISPLFSDAGAPPPQASGETGSERAAPPPRTGPVDAALVAELAPRPEPRLSNLSFDEQAPAEPLPMPRETPVQERTPAPQTPPAETRSEDLSGTAETVAAAQTAPEELTTGESAIDVEPTAPERSEQQNARTPPAWTTRAPAPRRRPEQTFETTSSGLEGELDPEAALDLAAVGGGETGLTGQTGEAETSGGQTGETETGLERGAGGASRGGQTAPETTSAVETSIDTDTETETETTGSQTEPAPAATTRETRPSVSLIVTAVGINPAATDRARAQLPLAVAFAVPPITDAAATIAEAESGRGRVVLLEAPLEPRAYPQVNPGPLTLMRGAAAENRARLAQALERTPGAVGVASFLGDAFLTDDAATRALVSDLSARALFAVETTPAAGGAFATAARNGGVPVVAGVVSLDDQGFSTEIAGALGRFEALARRQGRVVGSIVAVPSSVAALLAWLEGLEARGVSLVPLEPITP